MPFGHTPQFVKTRDKGIAMNRFYSCLYTLVLSQAVFCASALKTVQTDSLLEKNDAAVLQKAQYNHLLHNFDDMVKSKNNADYQLSCQNQKLAHILAFSDAQKKSLENRNSELVQKNYTQDKTLTSKNEQIQKLFDEINNIRTMLHNSLTTRNNLERAYLNLEQKLQLTQQNFLAQTKHLNHKLIETEVARTTSLMSEGKALQQVARLEQALKDNEIFYTQEMYQTFDGLAFELDETRKQLAIATDACFEGERELNMVKKQLEAAQSLISEGGVSAKSEKDLKTIQASLAKISKEALDSKGSYQQQLSQALDHIKKLDGKINKAQIEAEKNHREIQEKTAREAKNAQDLKIITNELARTKRSLNATIAQNTQQLTKTIKALEQELQTSKNVAARSVKTIQAKDIAFGALERHARNLQTMIAQEEETHKTLAQNLTSKESEIKNVQAKLARLETTEHSLRSLIGKTQQELKAVEGQKAILGQQLRTVSQKLASAELEKDKVAYANKNLTTQNAQLSQKLTQSEASASVLTEERNNYMFERHSFARIAQKAVQERDIYANRYETLLKTVSRAHNNSKQGISQAHPAGVAIL